MRWPEVSAPLQMRRVAVVAPTRRWPDVLAAVADSGVVEPDMGSLPSTAPAAGEVEPSAPGDELDRVGRAAVRDGHVTALAGWAPADAVNELDERLERLGGSIVVSPMPAGLEVPTALPGRRSSSSLRPLVDTYATVPYRDVDPMWFAAGAYVLMFGMMFGDVGDGLLLVATALLLRRSRGPRWAGVRRVWPLIVALGATAAGFGLLYGEAFGPTGLVPTIWLSPLDQPEQLLVAGVAVGAGLLACAYGIGIVNRWRESGPAGALWASTGVAGAALFLGLGLVAAGFVWSATVLWVVGLVVASIGLTLAAVGLRAQAGPGGAGATQAVVETFDLTIRLGSNVVSFARLAAFGLMHAALALVVWNATESLWGAGAAGAAAALAVFVVGHSVAFALEALVAGVQALRLEYYELFSRIFVGQGRPFRPWHVPMRNQEA